VTFGRRPLVVLLILLLGACARSAADRSDIRRITIVDFSDWHGQLEPVPVTVGGVTRLVGGAAVLKAYFDRERRNNPGGTLVVTAGDAFGATPPVASFLEDVPAVEAQNLMGVDIDTLGNHNFDHGLQRLEKLMALARFPYVAANIEGAGGRTLAPPTHVFTRNGVRIGVIGIANPETPVVVKPGAWATTASCRRRRRSIAMPTCSGARAPTWSS
jgi:5'-nucleotidase